VHAGVVRVRVLVGAVVLAGILLDESLAPFQNGVVALVGVDEVDRGTGVAGLD
jgi:hypothetical protein